MVKTAVISDIHVDSNSDYKEQFDRMSKDGRTWNDFLYNSWSQNNAEKCKWFLDKLEKQLKEFQESPIVFVTHMISHEAFKVPEERESWSYFNAFLGSQKLEELCKIYRVDYAICGHVHYRKDYEDGGTKWLCRCLNYVSEWSGEKDIHFQLADAVELLDL